MLDNPNSSKGSVVIMRRNSTVPTAVQSRTSKSSSSSFGAIRRRSTSLLLSSSSPTSKHPAVIVPLVTSSSSTSSCPSPLKVPTMSASNASKILSKQSGLHLKLDYNVQSELIQSILLLSTFDDDINSVRESSLLYNQRKKMINNTNTTRNSKTVVEIAASIPPIFTHSDILQYEKNNNELPYSYYSLNVASKRLNKTNPYIGSFRHSPPTRFRDVRFQVTSKSIAPLFNIRSTSTGSPASILPFSNKGNCRPRERCHSVSFFDTLDLESFKSIQSGTPIAIRTEITKKNGHTTFHRPNVSGRLRGGSPKTIFVSEKQSTANTSSIIENVTVNLLSGVTSWLLHYDKSLSYISDEHSVRPNYHHQVHDDEQPKRTLNELSECESSTLQVSPVVDDNDDDSSCSNSTGSGGDSTNSTTSSYDNYDTTHGSRIVPPDVAAIRMRTRALNNMALGLTTESSISALGTVPVMQSSRLDLSALSLQSDDASVAHLLFDASSATTVSNSSNCPRTDYETITQMDILRMARAASRHLDVDSIFQLPIITYHSITSASDVGSDGNGKVTNTSTTIEEESREGTNIVNNSSSIFRKSNDEQVLPTAAVKQATRKTNRAVEFSWMMVDTEPSDEGSGSVGSSLVNVSDTSTKNNNGFKIITTRTPSEEEEEVYDDFNDGDDSVVQEDNANDTEKNKRSDKEQVVDICVICFEQFKHGDRLRVLPCNHSFHVGCIDKWLCGSHSFHNCFTVGCPTCKKRPQLYNDTTTATTNNYCIPTTNAAAAKTNTTKTNGQENFTASYLYDSIDVSVPSWSFTKIGSALMQDK